MTSLDISTPSPAPSSNGLTYKALFGIVLTILVAGSGILYSAFSNTESQSVASLRERVAALEEGHLSSQSQLNRIEGELSALKGSVEKVDDKLDAKFEEVLRQLNRTYIPVPGTGTNRSTGDRSSRSQ